MVQISIIIQDKEDGSATNFLIDEYAKKESRMEGFYAEAARACFKRDVLPLLEEYHKAVRAVTVSAHLKKKA